MLEIGALAGQAVGIAAGFMAGVTQNMAANAVCSVIARRLRGTEQGSQTYDRLERNPQDVDALNAATTAVTEAAQSDPQYLQELRGAVQNFQQGNASDGSTVIGGVNIGGNLSGKNHQVAGGDITNDNRKRNIRIGVGAFAAVLLVAGGAGIATVLGGGDEPSRQTPGGSGANSSVDGSSVDAPTEKFTFDLQGKADSMYSPSDLRYRSRGMLEVTIGDPMRSYPPCNLTAPAGTTIVPLSVTYTNNNARQWKEEDAGFDSVVPAMIEASVPSSVIGYGHPATQACTQGFLLGGRLSGLGPGQSESAQLVLLGVPQDQEVKVTLVAGVTFEGESFQDKKFPFAVSG